MRSADRRRFAYWQQSRRIASQSAPNKSVRTRHFNALGNTRHPIATPRHCAIPAARIQIPIGAATLTNSIAASRGFLLRGLSNACPPALTRAARSSREGRHRTNLNETGNPIPQMHPVIRNPKLSCLEFPGSSCRAHFPNTSNANKFAIKARWAEILPIAVSCIVAFGPS